MFYSKTTNGFYDKGIHGDEIPQDAVEISADEHQMLLNGQSNGKVIAANDDGYPILDDQPEPTNEDKTMQCKLQAKKLLINSDWSQYADVANALTNKAEFDEYRATVRGLFLRPVPNPVFPETPDAVWGAQ